MYNNNILFTRVHDDDVDNNYDFFVPSGFARDDRTAGAASGGSGAGEGNLSGIYEYNARTSSARTSRWGPVCNKTNVEARVYSVFFLYVRMGFFFLIGLSHSLRPLCERSRDRHNV